MHRIILYILLLLSLGANGQVIIASAPYKPITTSGNCCDSILDLYPGATAAYSLRKLQFNYEGYSVLVRRSSDNTTQGIGFLTSGFFDTTSFKTFIGAGSGYVDTWYDQSGNINDMIAGSNSEQPQIILNAFGNKPALRFDGVDDALTKANFLGAATALTLFGVDSVGATSGANNGHWFEASASGQTSHYPFVDENIYDGVGTTARKSAGTPISALRAKHLYCVISASGDWRNYINNNAYFSTGTNTVGVSTNNFIGQSNGLLHNGTIAEIIIYSSSQSTGNRNGISANINNFYLIY